MNHPFETNMATQFEEITLSERIWHFIRFAVVTGIIFSVAFLAMNFSSYKLILADKLGYNSEAKQVLADATQNNIIDPELLLPVTEGEKEGRKSYLWPDAEIFPTDNRLVVPKLGISAPLVMDIEPTNIIEGNWNALEKEIQDGLEKGIVRYPGTANPGEFGNLFLTGHSSNLAWRKGDYNRIFALLPELEVGDRYYVYHNQKKHIYAIKEKRVVKATDVSVLQQDPTKKQSTLMTCFPIGTARDRMVVIAEEVIS